MKYFTEWLPVPGPVVTVGDKFIFNGALHTCIGFTPGTTDVQYDEGIDPVHGKFIVTAAAEHCQKVALQLCSHNVAVGAIVGVRDHPHIPLTKIIANNEQEMLWECDNGDWYDLDEIFSIAGFISPGAIWVRGGDEFEAEQIEMTATGKIVYWNGAIMSHYAWSRDDMFKYIRIKCPSCGTFH